MQKLLSKFEQSSLKSRAWWKVQPALKSVDRVDMSRSALFYRLTSKLHVFTSWCLVLFPKNAQHRCWCQKCIFHDQLYGRKYWQLKFGIITLEVARLHFSVSGGRGWGLMLMTSEITVLFITPKYHPSMRNWWKILLNKTHFWTTLIFPLYKFFNRSQI